VKLSLLFAAAAFFARCTDENRDRAPRETGLAGTLREPSPVIAEDTRSVIAVLGDSLTAGRGVEPEESYPSLLQDRLDAGGYRYRIVNAGVSGDTSAQGLNRLPAIRELRPAIAIVALGANDGLRGIPVEETRKNLDEIIQELKRDRVKIVLAGMEVPPNYGPDYTRRFRAMYSDLARKYETAFVPFLLEGVGGMPDLNQPDGIHPTAEGYRIVAENVWKVLQPDLD